MASSLEHLRRAQKLAYRARGTSTTNPAVQVRTWPYLTTAALESNHRIPHPSDSSRHIERIALAGDGLHEANQRHRTWPGQGNADPAFAKVVYALTDAARETDRPLTANQSQEAEQLIGQTLWLSANAASGSLRDHLGDLGRTMAREPGSPLMQFEYRRAHDAFGRFTAAENMATSLVAVRTAAASASAANLADAVATWDVEAHRDLLTIRSTGTLALIAKNEASVQGAFATAIDHAARRGAIDPHTAERLAPVLGSLSQAWSDLASSSTTLLWGPETVRQSTLTAADNLSQAFTSTNLDRESHQSQAAILTSLNSHLSSSLALAAAARELIEDRELTAPARAINAAVVKHHRGLERSTVSPVDLVAGKTISLTPEVRELLQQPADVVYYESEEAMRRGAGLDSLHRRTDAIPHEQLPPEGPTKPTPPLPGLGMNPQPLSPPL